ncbi:copper resistance protein CopC [Kocuria sp.]|uniref:copper resistance CopC/CopD family protein n=1 Tax=Kocuria sp. TaxID=1871328 RepID=UPI0028127B29|nr:copper resistance protein CopC [Kocuria sp.]
MDSTGPGTGPAGRPPAPARRRRRGLRVVLVAALAALLTVLGAPAATAHTELVGTDPADGQVLQSTPTTITLSFNEPVGATPEAVRLLAPSGDRIPLTARALDSTVGLTPSTALGDGTHTVLWQVTSADGHPVSGSFTFSVGEPTATTVEVQQHAPSAATAHYAAQTLTYAGVLATSGLVVFDLLLFAPRPGTALRARRRLHRLMHLGAALAVAGTVVSVLASVLWQAGAAPVSLTDGALWRAAAGSGSALAAVLTTAGVLTAALAAPRAAGRGGGRLARGAALGGAGLAGASLVVIGHTRSAEPAWLVVPADAVHVAAGLVWVGGILGLVTVLGRTSDASPRQATLTLSRFSAVAGWVVLALAATGLLLGWRILGGPGALVSTGYGRILLLKIAVVLGVVAVAAWNRFVHLPRVLTRPDSRVLADLQSTIQGEGALLVLVLAVTGVLTSLSP